MAVIALQQKADRGVRSDIYLQQTHETFTVQSHSTKSILIKYIYTEKPSHAIISVLHSPCRPPRLWSQCSRPPSRPRALLLYSQRPSRQIGLLKARLHRRRLWQDWRSSKHPSSNPMCRSLCQDSFVHLLQLSTRIRLLPALFWRLYLCWPP